MKPIDPLQLQRLVDGELDQPQIQQMLSAANATPQQWQEIAVGFVENQIWERAFLSDETASSPASVATAPAAEGPTPADQNSVQVTPPTVKNELQRTEDHRVDRHPSRHHRSIHSRLVMAASLLAAATIGYMGNQIQNRILPSTKIAENASAPSSEPLIANNTEPKTPGSQLRPAVLEPDYHLEVPQDNEYLRDMAAGPVAPVPLYRIGNAEQLKQFNQQRDPVNLPPEILQHLSGSGYQMQQDINFISGHLGDGRSFVVPVRTIRFVPGQ